MDQKNILSNLHKAKKHIEKIEMMVREERYCIDIMQQILAVQGYLKSTHATLLTHHLATCTVKKLSEGDEREQKQCIQEILKVCQLAQKS